MVVGHIDIRQSLRMENFQTLCYETKSKRSLPCVGTVAGMRFTVSFIQATMVPFHTSLHLRVAQNAFTVSQAQARCD